jgi:hypothetical protein
MKKIIFLLVAALLLGTGTIDAQKARKKGKAKAKTSIVAKPGAASVTAFTGTYENSYSDGIGGMVTDYLAVDFDEATGTATGTYKNEMGDLKTFSGKLQGGKLVCTFDEDGDTFATMHFYDGNTLKLEGFTGTFKRTSYTYKAVEPDAPQEVTPAGSVSLEEAAEQVRRAAAAGAPTPTR